MTVARYHDDYMNLVSNFCRKQQLTEGIHNLPIFFEFMFPLSYSPVTNLYCKQNTNVTCSVTVI